MRMHELRTVIAKVETPIEVFSLLGVWPCRSNGSLGVRLSRRAFWRVVECAGGDVTLGDALRLT